MAISHAVNIETRFVIPGMDPDVGRRTAGILQDRLVALLDLTLTLKHVHWNVVGPSFIGVHKMLDEQVDAVRLMSDEVAERIAALGASPNGLPGSLVERRSWDDYSLMRGTTLEHLGGLDLVYCGLIGSHRVAMEELGDIEPVSQDMLIDQLKLLEQFHWFVRAHLESSDGHLSTSGAENERAAARQAQAGAAR
jgi:starvation-inducible DNA-binding protein